MPLTTGTRVGPYEILGAIGAGGMGEVYRGHDTSLGRDVAIKILPPAFSSDPERRLRFEREAQVLAALNHPNIAAIYGLVETDLGRGLVLEFVDGPTLADLIAERPAEAREEALAIARQIVDALEAAHDKGIIHRDLKPANVKAVPGGPVKVLDFGLAKAIEPAGTEGASTESLTITSPAALTRAGVILGTAVYMSPEQARGRSVDKRADIWAFGCVLYELLSGRRPFEGETVADIVTAILGKDPDWSAVAFAPAPVQRLLRHCLEKDPRRRLRDIADARRDLDDTVAAVAPSVVPGEVPGVAPRRWVLAGAAAAILTVAVAALTGRFSSAGSEAAPSPPIRFSIPMPPGVTLWWTVEALSLAMAPDGSALAFVGVDSGGVRRVWIRPLDSLEARPIANTEDAISVFWKPDSKSIGFFSGGRLRRLDLAGGVPVTICEVQAGVGFHGSWGATDEALFASIEGRAIMRVSMTAAGKPVEVLKPSPADRETRVTWPSFLPDGKRFLYVSQNADHQGRVMVAGLDEAPRLVVAALSSAQYVAPGHVLFVREGSLFALPFDGASGQTTGEPVSLGESIVYMLGPGRAMFSASQTGVLALQSHRDQVQLTWVDRAGTETGTVGAVGDILRTRLARDDRRALFDRAEPTTGAYDLWVADFDRGVEQQLTTAPEPEGAGTWMPDGRAAFYMIARGGPPRIHRRDLQTGAVEAVLPQRGLQEPEDVSHDGQLLLFSERTAEGEGAGEYDLWTLSLSAGAEPKVLVRTRRNQFDARFSPDDRFIAYTSDESGRPEVYVMPLTGAGAPRQVSPGGGRLPRWSRDSTKLFYLSPTQELMAVPVQDVATMRLGAASPAFPGRPAVRWRTFDVAADGRFLAVVTQSLGGAQPITIRTSWAAGLGN